MALFTGCGRLDENRLCGGAREREREMKAIDQGLAQIRDASTLGIVCLPIEGFPLPGYHKGRPDLP